MIQRKRSKERFAERRHPGDPEAEQCMPGSIEQQLDMCEEGTLRGDEILHHRGRREAPYTGDPTPLTDLIDQVWNTDLSEEDREGDESSGDEHSFGSGDAE